jgi:hypothetical protein
VLVVGGRSREGLWKRQAPRTIDPASGDVEQLEPIRTGRYPSFETVDADTAVKLDDGRVLVIAGHPDLDRSSLVIFDPATDEFQPVAEVEGAYRVWPVAPTPGLLPDGRVVIMLGAPRSSIQTLGADEAGGASPSPMPMDPVFVFDPDTAEVTLITTVPGRDRSSLTVLDDGDVLIGGGEVSMGEASAEAWRLSVPDPRA